jgi:hypothetical protein
MLVKSAWLPIVVLPLLVCACSKKEIPQVQAQSSEVSVDHLANLKTEEPKNVVHGIFPVKKYTQFAFIVPAHQGYPKLQGDFQSFTKRRDPDATSDKTADVGLVLLNDREFVDFQQGRPGTTTYELNPAHDQVVDWQVPNTYDQPQQYHLVFSNPDGGPKTKFVKADFTISFK